MGTIKYSTIETSNGILTFEDNPIHEREFDNMEYLKIFDVVGRFKIYINNSKDFILLKDETLELQDFHINSLKIEAISQGAALQYYLCK